MLRSAETLCSCPLSQGKIKLFLTDPIAISLPSLLLPNTHSPNCRHLPDATSSVKSSCIKNKLILLPPPLPPPANQIWRIYASSRPCFRFCAPPPYPQQNKTISQFLPPPSTSIHRPGSHSSPVLPTQRAACSRQREVKIFNAQGPHYPCHNFALNPTSHYAILLQSF